MKQSRWVLKKYRRGSCTVCELALAKMAIDRTSLNGITSDETDLSFQQLILDKSRTFHLANPPYVDYIYELHDICKGNFKNENPNGLG